MSLLERKQNRGTDNLDTPKIALRYLLPYLKKDWIIWECAAGERKLAKCLMEQGLNVIDTDIKDGKVDGRLGIDFLDERLGCVASNWDCIITNPPFSKKNEFLQRCYEYGKSFALLLPITALEGQKRQALYREHGLEVIFLPKRIDFTGKKAPWFAVAWFTHGLNIGKEMTFSI